MSENQNNRVIFTQEMKKTYKILVPTMLPIHFAMLVNVLEQYDYDIELLENTSRSVVDEGLKNVHNDMCYPALLVIGQMIDALESGKYDPNKTAFLITQTGGGCRASNYIFLLRKALERSGYGHVPVISLNVGGLEKNPGFKLSLPLLDKIMYALLYGDLLMLLSNQCKPYEKYEGETQKLVNSWVNELIGQMNGKAIIRYKKVKENYQRIVKDFSQIERHKQEKVRVGIVGEIYVKFSPLGNNNLEDFLLSENAEVVVPGLLDFCMYCIYNGLVDHELYGGKKFKYLISKIAYKFVLKKQNDLIKAVKENSDFRPMGDFDHNTHLVKGYINKGVKMGEGWLLTAEMLELIEQGVTNIVCTQPFGCLPNHIAGKGMMRKIKERNPQANIVAVDYDPGATKINQENRIKLMLANAEVLTKN